MTFEQLENAQFRALSEPSLIQARYGINQTIDQAKSVLDSVGPNEALSRLCSIGYGHLASLADSALDRTRYRNLALKVCRDGLTSSPSSAVLATAYANAAVDWFYDSFAIADYIGRRSVLSGARKHCERRKRPRIT